MKRVLIFSIAYHPFIGGAEVAVKEITDRIGSDFKFDMITVNLDGRQKTEETIGNIKIYRVGQGKLSKYLLPWLGYKKAKELHQRHNYQIIWAIMANQAALAALKFKRKFKQVKYLLTLQEGDSELAIWMRTWFIRWIYKAIYRQANFIQTISSFLAKRAEKLGSRCPNEVVPNGVDMEKFENNAPSSLTIDKIRNDLGIKSDEKVIITTSRLVKKNGLDSLIKAVPKLQNVKCKLLIAGDGQEDNKLRDLVRKLKVENRVLFLGFVSPEKLPGYYVLADCFCRPSLSEGLGNSFLEAMAAGVPVVATPVGGIPDFLRDNKTGWFCKSRNPVSIAKKINYILDKRNREEVKKVTATARKMVKENYNWDKISEKIKNILIKLAA